MFHTRHKKSESTTTDLPSSSLTPSSVTSVASDPINIPYHADISNDKGMHSSGLGASPATSSSNTSRFSIDTMPMREENTTVISGLSSLLIKHTSRAFPVPSLCIFSRTSLADEYAPQEAIVPFYHPPSIPLERICMLVSVLESLFRTMDDVTLTDDEEEEEEENRPQKQHQQKEQDNGMDDYAFKVIGLGTFKVAVWKDWEEDRALAVIVSTRISDDTLEGKMRVIRSSLSDPSQKANEQLGPEVVQLVQELFS